MADFQVSKQKQLMPGWTRYWYYIF